MRWLIIVSLLGWTYGYVIDYEYTEVKIDSPGVHHWFPNALPSDGCEIDFHVKGSRDLVITFSPEKSYVKDIYETVIGAYNNRFVCIRDENGKEPIVDVQRGDIITGDWQVFRIEFKTGYLVVSLEENDRFNRIAEFQDPTPYSCEQWYVGVTSLVESSEWKVKAEDACFITRPFSSNPTPPVDPDEPTEPVGLVDPTDPADPVDPDEPIDLLPTDDPWDPQPLPPVEPGSGSSDETSERSAESQGSQRSGSNPSRSDGSQSGASRDGTSQRSAESQGSQGSGSNPSGVDGSQSGGSSDETSESSAESQGSQRSGSNTPGSDGSQSGGSSDGTSERSEESQGSEESGPNSPGSDGSQSDDGSETNGGGLSPVNSISDSSQSEESGTGGASPSSDGSSSISESRGSDGNDGNGEQPGSDDSNSGVSGGNDDDSNSGVSGGNDVDSNSGVSGGNDDGPDSGLGDNNDGGDNDEGQTPEPIDEYIEFDIDGKYPPTWNFIPHPLQSPDNFILPFSVKASSAVYLRLSASPDDEDPVYYEIMIGVFANSFVCVNRSEVQVIDNFRDGVLNEGAVTNFVVKFDGSKLTLFKESGILAEYIDDQPLQGIKYVGATSFSKNGGEFPSWWSFKGSFFGY